MQVLIKREVTSTAKGLGPGGGYMTHQEKSLKSLVVVGDG